MAEFTDHYNFEKSEGSDLLTPDPYNNNLDIIDSELYSHSLAIGNAQPWFEIVDFEETNISVPSGGALDYYRNYTDQTKSIGYYDKLFLMIYAKLTAINADTSHKRYFYLYPAFYTNGTLSSKTRMFGLSVNPETSVSWDRLWRNESSMFMMNNVTYGTMSDQANYYFPQWRRTPDGEEWSGEEYNYFIAYKPFSVSQDANQFGIQLTTGTNMTMTVQNLKVKLYGQRTYGSMRF